jgi:hypothetical protein
MSRLNKKWYAATGCVVEVRATADGDVHIALQDATGDKLGIVVLELPAKPQWGERCRTVVRFNCDNGTQAH